MSFSLKHYYSGNWQDISDYLISSDNVPFASRNRDWSVRSEVINISIASSLRGVSPYAIDFNFSINEEVAIYSDSTIIYHGYITRTELVYESQVFEIELSSILNKLNGYMVNYTTLHTQLATGSNWWEYKSTLDYYGHTNVGILWTLKQMFALAGLTLTTTDIEDDIFFSNGLAASGDVTYKYLFMLEPALYSINQNFCTPNPANNETKTITAVTYSAGYFIITAAGHNFEANDNIVISGVNGMTDLNGQWAVDSVISANQFQVAGYTAQTYSSGGSVYNADYAANQITFFDFLSDICMLLGFAVQLTDVSTFNLLDLFIDQTHTVADDDKYSYKNESMISDIEPGDISVQYTANYTLNFSGVNRANNVTLKRGAGSRETISIKNNLEILYSNAIDNLNNYEDAYDYAMVGFDLNNNLLIAVNVRVVDHDTYSVNGYENRVLTSGNLLWGRVRSLAYDYTKEEIECPSTVTVTACVENFIDLERRTSNIVQETY